jgi:hypothetical protein
MEKISPYKHKEVYLNWKKKGVIEDVSKPNSDLIRQYILDMENGVNISSKNVKGGRSYARLNALR